ncbi:unnamed protein product, partial [Ectocarpus sp. 8 AP-2014]
FPCGASPGALGVFFRPIAFVEDLVAVGSRRRRSRHCRAGAAVAACCIVASLLATHARKRSHQGTGRDVTNHREEVAAVTPKLSMSPHHLAVTIIAALLVVVCWDR